MTDTQIIIDEIDVTSCIYACRKLNKDGLHDCRIPNTAPFCCENIHNCYYKQLKRKEQECEELKRQHQSDKGLITATGKQNYQLLQEYDKLKAENEKMSKGYSKLTEIVSPYMDDFTGYNEEFGGFDLILCIKELMEQLDQLKAENDNLKSLIWWIHVGAEGADKATTEYYENRNTPYEENYWKRIRALQPPTYESKYKLALTEIKEIAEKRNYLDYNECLDDILQKISEVEDGN